MDAMKLRELRFELVDLTEGISGTFLACYDCELKALQSLPLHTRRQELEKLATRIKKDHAKVVGK